MNKAKKNLVLGILAVIVGLVCIFVIAPDRDKLKNRCTEKTSGVVTSVSETRDNEGGGSDYYITVEYEVGGKKYSDNLSTGTRVEYDETVTLWYNPDDPTECYIDGVTSSPFMFRLCGGVFIVVGALFTLVDGIKFIKLKNE